MSDGVSEGYKQSSYFPPLYTKTLIKKIYPFATFTEHNNYLFVWLNKDLASVFVKVNRKWCLVFN